MNLVEPIKEERELELLKQELKNHNFRDYFLMILALNTGIKISDLLWLRFEDMMVNDQCKTSIHINDIEYPLNTVVREAFKAYHTMLGEENNRPDLYIFQSRKGQSPIDRSHAYRILNDAAKQAGITVKVGPQTIRKTFGYHHYKQHRDIKYLQKLFKHSSSKQTLTYIGVNNHETVLNEFSL